MPNLTSINGMNQRQLLIISYILYIIPIPLIGWGGLIISATATEYRTKHIFSIKLFIGANIGIFIGIAIIIMGGGTNIATIWQSGIAILLFIAIWYYGCMFSNLFQAMKLKD